jgi:hypothetical protein
MSSDLLSLLNRVARSMESVVPGLELAAEILEPVWLEDDAIENDVTRAPSALTGEWVHALGFEMRYRGVWRGRFEHASSGSEREQVQAVALELMSQVQDVVAETTTEPWPLVVVDSRRDMALADATIEGDDLHMWYGEHGAPALKLPSVHLG